MGQADGAKQAYVRSRPAGDFDAAGPSKGRIARQVPAIKSGRAFRKAGLLALRWSPIGTGLGLPQSRKSDQRGGIAEKNSNFCNSFCKIVRLVG